MSMGGFVRTIGLMTLTLLFGAVAAAAQSVWSPFDEASVVRLATQDEDGSERETPVWFVVVAGDGFVRTNDSRWLANIRRGSSVVLRLDETSRPVVSEEVSDAALTSAVEEAFKAKYGLMQRMMSAFRMREPTVLRLRQLGP
jgi:hypothetical protein